VVIHGAGEAGRPFGLLEAHSRTLRAFSPDDVSFLQALANLLAAAVLRAENERRLRAAERAAEEERGRAHIAEEALRARDEFLSVASHELRTPVAALQLQLEALRELSAPLRDRGDARIADKAERAAASVARLARLVESVLDVSRIVLGRLRLEPEPLDLAEVAATVTERHVEAARRAGCALRFDGASPLSGAWDRARVEQVLGHLLSNAIKFGAGQPIDVRVEPRPGGARVTVADRGPGIAPADLSRILDRFERAVSHRNYGGLGLGLYLAGQIVRAHGGNLQVVSAPGQGATFIVDL
jgi:signal transduction histidine kinase